MMFLRSFFWQVISMVQDEVVIYLIQSWYNPFLHASPELQFEFCFLESSDERFFKAGSWAAHHLVIYCIMCMAVFVPSCVSFFYPTGTEVVELHNTHGCVFPLLQIVFFLEEKDNWAGRSSNWSHLALISSFKTWFIPIPLSTFKALVTIKKFF